MDEVFPAIVAYATAMQIQSGFTQLLRAYAGQTNVNGPGLHVQAVLGDRRRTMAKKFIAPGRPVSTDHVDLFVRASNGRGEIVQQVEQPRVKVTNFSGTVVAEKTVKLRDAFRQVLVAFAIGHVDMLIGVGVIQAQATNISRIVIDSVVRAKRHRHSQSKNKNENNTRHQTNSLASSPCPQIRQKA